MLTRGDLVSNAAALVSLWRFTPEDRLLQALPIYPLHGLFTTVVVAAPGLPLDEAHIVAALAGGLARFKQPKRGLFASELPRNAMGRVRKALLRARFSHLYEAD